MAFYVVTTTDDTAAEEFGRHTFETRIKARNFADDAKAHNNKDYIVVRMETVYTTQTIDEALEGEK